MKRRKKKRRKYLKIGERGVQTAAAIEVKGIPEILFLCEDGKSHERSFEILQDILTSIFSETELKNPSPAEEYGEYKTYQIVYVKKACLGREKWALFRSRDEVLLVKKHPSSAELVKNWIREIRYSLI
ncbi:hypothetical protein J7K03_00580 [bacterium]|nr:hypothetical protein [bacterium]